VNTRNIVFVLLGCLIGTAASRPPVTHTDSVKETIHGVSVVDPYRWLEDQQSPATRDWIKEQNAYSRSLLDPLPQRAYLTRRFEEILKTERISLPRKKAGRYFYTRRRPEESQAVLYVRDGEKGAERALVDPNKMQGTVSVSLATVSEDGAIAAYRLQRGGEDEVAVHLVDAGSGKLLPDSFPRARYSLFSFHPDGKSLYFSRFEKDGSRVWRHRLGDPPGRDTEVFGRGYDPANFSSCSVSSNSRWLLCRTAKGSTQVNPEIFVADLKNGGILKPVVRNIDAHFFPAIGGDRLFLHTDWKAPNGRILVVDATNPSQGNWKEVVPESVNAIEGMNVLGGQLAVWRLVNVKSTVTFYTLGGRVIRELATPGFGALSGPAGDWNSDEAFYAFESFAQPETIYAYSISTGRQSVWSRRQVPIDPAPVEVKQVWYESKDGTRIPMFVAHKKGIRLDGNNPTYLTGYGGFLASELPVFSPTGALWIEMGGVWALPNLRGGGEFGEKWHQAGMLQNKQNVFDDFIAAAKWLITNKYTRPARLAISGRSNGGLLVGAAMTQRPELFGAVLCGVPLLDMVRYHKFRVARFWIPEYGSSDDPVQFQFIHRYSPYHRVREGTKYPAVLYFTGDSDTRVDPLHARKMAALMQAAQGGDKPVLLLYDTEFGHSGGMPVSKQAEQMTDHIGFLMWQLGWNTPDNGGSRR
jgi:prolyl oligopeptidase